jgi:DNA invertase Pin-like site-specific DNA recombinase
MSTEHQQYSTENQSDVIRRYAESKGMVIVRTYVDAGRSGLILHSRHALQQLIGEVEGKKPDFEAILVYDVSRWGRFQDTDESAYYEFLCKRAKVQVHYCAETFVNDGSLSSTLLKAIKRMMAGEYSRELSVKVFAGKCRLAQMGFRQGGHAGYGLRRLLVDQDGKSKGLLNYGERKSMFTDRVILIPGSEEEIAIVREIFTRYIESRESIERIAGVLNSRGVPNERSGLWTRAIVRNTRRRRPHSGSRKLD